MIHTKTSEPAFRIEEWHCHWTRSHEFVVHYGLGHRGGLAWDEMLGTVAQLIYTYRGPGFSSYTPRSEFIQSVKFFHVETCYWTLQRDDGHFIDRLQCDEALGFIAHYFMPARLHGMPAMFGGFTSYQARMKKWYRALNSKEIHGFISTRPA
jgi:hypothetical protein